MHTATEHEAEFHSHGEQVAEPYPQVTEHPLRTGVGKLTQDNGDGTYTMDEQVWTGAAWTNGTAPGQYMGVTVRDISESTEGDVNDYVLFWEQYDQDGLVELVVAAGLITSDEKVASKSGQTAGYLNLVLMAANRWLELAFPAATVNVGHADPEGGAHAYTMTLERWGDIAVFVAIDDKGHIFGWWDSKGANWKSMAGIAEPTSTTALDLPVP